MSKKLAFSYIRMSTETQLKGNSLERQLQLTRDYAEEKGFQLVEDLRDIGISAYHGANIKKGKLGLFLKSIERGEIDSDCILLVESLDRLSRESPADAFSQFNDILKTGIEIHTVFDRQIYTQSSLKSNPGQLFSSIGYMLRAHSESEEKSRRLKKSWQNKRNNLDKGILTTVCPAWLEASKKKTDFRIIPERAKTIEKIFELYIDEGMGAYSIARFLNTHLEQFPKFSRLNNKSNRNMGWQKSYVLKILNNPAVCGEFIPHEMINGKRHETNTVYENYFPAVITKDRFLLTQSLMKNKSNKSGGRKGDNFSNIFTKLLICGNCGATVQYLNKGKPPKGQQYLRCGGAELRHSCNSTSWRYDDFEKHFFDFVSEVEFEEALKKGNDKSLKTKLSDEQKINEMKINQIDRKIDQLLDLEGEIKDAAKKKLTDKINDLSIESASIEKRQKEIELELTAIEGRNSKETKKELLIAIEEQQKLASSEERASLRRRIHSQISKIVSEIKMYNEPIDFYPWEDISEILPLLVRRAIDQKGYTKEQFIELLKTDHGKRLINEMGRHFVVVFKNGAQKKIHPYTKMSWKHDNKKFLAFIGNIEKREQSKLAAEALAKRQKSSKYKTRSIKNKNSEK